MNPAVEILKALLAIGVGAVLLIGLFVWPAIIWLAVVTVLLLVGIFVRLGHRH